MIGRYLEPLGTKREVAFASATNAFSARPTASQQQPSPSETHQWEKTNPEFFSFGNILGDWLVFKGQLAALTVYDPAIHDLCFDFCIEKNHLVRSLDDDMAADPEGRFWINGKVIAAIDEFHSGAQIDEWSC